jgi:hypothetical protein
MFDIQSKMIILKIINIKKHKINTQYKQKIVNINNHLLVFHPIPVAVLISGYFCYKFARGVVPFNI